MKESASDFSDMSLSQFLTKASIHFMFIKFSQTFLKLFISFAISFSLPALIRSLTTTAEIHESLSRRNK